MKRSLTCSFQTLQFTIVNSHPQSVAARVSKLRTKNRPIFIIIRLLLLYRLYKHGGGSHLLACAHSSIISRQTTLYKSTCNGTGVNLCMIVDTPKCMYINGKPILNFSECSNIPMSTQLTNHQCSFESSVLAVSAMEQFPQLGLSKIHKTPPFCSHQGCSQSTPQPL